MALNLPSPGPVSWRASGGLGALGLLVGKVAGSKKSDTSHRVLQPLLLPPIPRLASLTAKIVACSATGHREGQARQASYTTAGRAPREEEDRKREAISARLDSSGIDGWISAALASWGPWPCLPSSVRSHSIHRHRLLHPCWPNRTRIYPPSPLPLPPPPCTRVYPA